MNLDVDRYVIVDQLKNNIVAYFNTRHEAINFLFDLPRQVFIDYKGIYRYRFVLSLDRFEVLSQER